MNSMHLLINIAHYFLDVKLNITLYFWFLNTIPSIENTTRIALGSEIAKTSDKIVMVAGLPIHSENPVNTVRVIVL